MAAVYALASLRLPVLVARPVLCGAAYGLVVNVVMQYVVLPLSAFRAGPPAPPGTIDWGQVNLWLAHVFCVGLPIAFTRQMGCATATSDKSVMMSRFLASSTLMRLFLVALALAATTLAVPSAAPDSLLYARLDSYLEALRVQAGIPGLSAAIVGDTDIVWERGLRPQDLSRGIAGRSPTRRFTSTASARR